VTRILLLRHGQSVWNAAGRWQGRADPPLSPLGREQAQVASEALEGGAVIFSSDLVRARETAEILAGRHEVRIDPRLRERDGGEWTGLTRPEIEERWPGYLADGRRPDGFETDEEVIERAWAALTRIVEEVPDGVVVVVSHGGLIRALERHLGLGDGGAVPNLGGRWVQIDGADVTVGDRHLLIDPEEVEVTAPGLL
jgi:broad specificity phosphatase PhoE